MPRTRNMISALSLVALFAVAACGDNFDLPVTIGGTVSGLGGKGLVLANNGTDVVAMGANGAFEFTGTVPAGSAYAVTVQQQPSEPTQTCTIANASGIAGAAGVSDIVVTCRTGVFAVGGTVTGLEGAGLILQNNGTDDLALAADGSFAFTTPLLSGTSFAVTIVSQPSEPTQTCSVSGGAGTLGAGQVSTVVINCATDRFTVGGIVAGLDGTVVLQNASGHEVSISSNGSFAFPVTIRSGDAYEVTVAAQPATPLSQTCTVSHGAGTVTDADITEVRVDCTTNAFAVGGTVTGLAGTGLVLQNNAGDTLPLDEDGAFVFATDVTSGEPYAVTVLAQPLDPSQECVVANATGTIGGTDIDDITVTCTTRRFDIGGSTYGLLGEGLVLQNHGAEDLPIATDGPFQFATPVASGAPYAVTIAAQPTNPWQTCGIWGGTGTVGAGPVSTINVNCTIDRFTLGGTVAGLAGTLALETATGDVVIVTGNGEFAFPGTVASGAAYDVTVATQPTAPISQTCTIAHGDGTVGGDDVTSIAVTCTTNHFMINGAVTGLAGTGLVLQQSGANDKPLSANGAFAFTAPVASGTTYDVTVRAQPTNPSQTCVLSNASGMVGAADVTGVSVTCTTDRFAVGGSITGLAGTGLVLQNHGGDDLALATNGTFAFGTRVASNGTYDVTIATQPSSPSQTCVVGGGTGTVTSGPITGITITCTTDRFAVGGTVTGLVGDGLVLQANAGDDLAILDDGTFSFSTRIASGAPFAVTVLAQPTGPHQTCTISGGTGTVGAAAVTSIAVNCATNTYAVGGLVEGLVGTVVLQDAGGAEVTVTGNGTFAFLPFPSGRAYDITVKTQPTSPWQTCTVTGGTGTVTSAPIDTVEVSCTTRRYAVTGTVTGLAPSTSVVLRNNGADDLVVFASGTFTFPVTVPSGTAYAVTVLTQPAEQTCTVTAGTGTIAGAAIIDVAVTCASNGFRTGGTINLVDGGTVELEDASGATYTASASGPFLFSTRTPTGEPYAVSVKTAPEGQTCTVTNGTGTMGSSDVTDVLVTCMLPCFAFTNGPGEDLVGNNWFDACVDLPGDTVTVTLLDANGQLVYSASGPKIGAWTYDHVTSTHLHQFDWSRHERLITLDNGDKLMIAGRAAGFGACYGSLGSGYGITLYNDTPSGMSNIKLLAMPYLAPWGQVRGFPGWTPAHEISWNGGEVMNSCGGVTAFAGTITITISVSGEADDI